MSGSIRNDAPALAPGRCLPDARIRTSEGELLSLSDFKGRFNLLLVFARESAHPALDLLARRYEEVRQREAEVIVLLQCDPDDAGRLRQMRGWPFVVGSDGDGSVARRLGGGLTSETLLCVTDRWGEIFWVSPLPAREAEERIAEALAWLDFIEIQCPECFPSEWRD